MHFHRLFYTVGVFGYLYSYDETRDNILLNFPLSVTTVLVGRIGYGVTIMFGMPLVFLPCRAAILSLPTQIKEWRDAIEDDNVHRKGTKHHIANGVTFDEACPLLLETGKLATTTKAESGTISTELSGDDQSYETIGVAVSTKPVPVVDPSLEEEAARDRRVHVVATLGIVVLCYLLAVGVPGVGVVWRIAGSSMAIVIGFIIPASCYLKIRLKKSANPRSSGALVLLVFSVISSVVCTYRTLGDLSTE